MGYVAPLDGWVHAAGLALKLLGLAARRLGPCNSSTRKIGIIGFDAAAQELALRARHGFAMTVLIHTATPVADAALQRAGARHVPLADLLARADVVSLHGAPQDWGAGGPLITGARLDQMKPEAVLINAGDRALVDEAALAQSLMFDTIAGAALAVAPGQDLHPMLSQCDSALTLAVSEVEHAVSCHLVA